MSHRLWQRHYGSDPNIVGKTIQLNGRNRLVVGVMPQAFQFPIQNDPVELWTTVAVDSEGETPVTVQRGAHYMNVIARLKPGVDFGAPDGPRIHTAPTSPGASPSTPSASDASP